jgi:hypothetical protein
MVPPSLRGTSADFLAAEAFHLRASFIVTQLARVHQREGRAGPGEARAANPSAGRDGFKTA